MNFKGLRDRIAFEAGRPYDQNNINPGNRTMAQQYMESVTPGAEQMQEALMQLAGRVPLGKVANRGSGAPGQTMLAGGLDRMAASENMLRLLQAMPAAAAVGGVVGAGDIVAGEESFANKGMDLLGMGVGAYGMHRGRVGGTTRAGAALAAMAGMGIGKLGSDAVQGGIGGIL